MGRVNFKRLSSRPPSSSHSRLSFAMDGSSNIPVPSFRLIPKKEPDQLKSLPFSFKRQDPVSVPKQRQNNSKNNENDPGPVQTQSFRLPENISHQQPSSKHLNSSSKPSFSSLPQAFMDHSRRPSSHIARPIFGSHFKASFKTEENASNQGRASSPLVHQAHIPPFHTKIEQDHEEHEEPQAQASQYSPPSSNTIKQHPFPSLLSSFSARPSSGGQPPSHVNHFSLSSSYPVQKFPESPSKLFPLPSFPSLPLIFYFA